MESEVHQMIWFQRGKSSFYFWNQFRILVYFNLHRSLPWKLKSHPKSGKSSDESRIIFLPERPTVFVNILYRLEISATA